MRAPDRMGSSWRSTIAGAGQIAGTVLAAPVLRRRYNRWGATPAEVAAALPGDELVPEPKLGYTRAITIDAPPQHVWPWLVQIGQGRGGFYSYDRLENLARCDIHSADRIVADYQDLAPEDLVRLGPPGYPCFRVWQVTAPSDLVLVGVDPKPPYGIPDADDPAGVATWQWAVRPFDDGRRARLLVRQRLTYSPGLSVLWHVVEPVGFVMEREMLRGIKRRAEARS